MPSINESIEQLTASLQELATQSDNQMDHPEPLTTGHVPVHDLCVSQEVEAFLETTRTYAAKTRNISVGMY